MIVTARRAAAAAPATAPESAGSAFAVASEAVYDPVPNNQT